MPETESLIVASAVTPLSDEKKDRRVPRCVDGRIGRHRFLRCENTLSPRKPNRKDDEENRIQMNTACTERCTEIKRKQNNKNYLNFQMLRASLVALGRTMCGSRSEYKKQLKIRFFRVATVAPDITTEGRNHLERSPMSPSFAERDPRGVAKQWY